MSEDKGKISTRKIMIAVFSLAMVAGFIVLFVAASNSKRGDSCTGLIISFEKKNNIAYADTAYLRKKLLSQKELNPMGKPIVHLKLQLTKQIVDKQDWVKNADVYIGNHNLLYIKIDQKIPVARVFTKSGNSFYLDEAGDKISVRGEFTIKLPVFTGYPDQGNSKSDSSLLLQVKKMSKFIAKNVFWKAQTDQVNINANQEFEITPHVGDALILFGDGSDINRKFAKLLTFYKEGLNNVGWGYYDTIDLRYDGQVVASRKKGEDNPVVTALVTHNDSENLKEIRKEIAKNEILSGNVK